MRMIVILNSHKFNSKLFIAITHAMQTINNNLDVLFTLPVILLRAYVSAEDKINASKAVPTWFTEIMCGVMLGDGYLRMHGIHALLSIQQTHKEITECLWSICHSLNLVINPINPISQGDWKIIYTFQSLTMPYFTTLWHDWYSLVDGRSVKRLPANILDLLTPLALAHWIMGDGSFDGYGRGLGRVVLHTDNFTHAEVQLLRDILKSKFNIESGVKVGKPDPVRGHQIRISAKSLVTLRDISMPHMYPSLLYKLGM
ncbi:MAG: hypothetical protein EOP45_00420 [Sphingobacteriaceae bacterium]|nr:MAG: hypothetical protein EOP45_00420 [Sphingobacteriaceae bacterium]